MPKNPEIPDWTADLPDAEFDFTQGSFGGVFNPDQLEFVTFEFRDKITGKKAIYSFPPNTTQEQIDEFINNHPNIH
jgi:hypothetical protein